MKYIKTLTIAFLFLLNQAGAFAQITVIIQQPPPYQFKVEHIWKVTLVNPTRTTFTVSLHSRVTETDEGLIVHATTTRFVLPPGTKMINTRELVPINIRDANPRYRDVVQNIGGLPSGAVATKESTASSRRTDLGSMSSTFRPSVGHNP